MMSCLSASRGYPQRTTRVGIKSLPSSCPPAQPQPQTSQSACSSAVSDGKCSISSSETSSSPVVLTKKPRSRRRRPHEIYNEAAAALSAIYPKIFSCPPNKQQQQQQNNSSNSTAIPGKKSKRSLYADDDSELLQEVPTFVRRARDMELLLFCNQSGAEAEAKSKSTDFQGQVPDNSLAHSPTPSSDAKSQSQSQSQSEMVAMSPSCVDYCCDWDDLSTVEYDCLLDSSDDAIDAGIMSAIMGDSGEASSSSADNGCVVPDAVAVAVVAGEAAAAQQRLQCSAIRSLRRASDCMSAPVSDFHGRSRLRILDRVMADKYKNSSSSNSMMSLCSLDWLKAEVAAAPRRLKLKLNYEDVLSAWSDRGPLFADDSAASPHFGFVDSAFGSMAAAGYGYDWVPDMSFWRSVDENGMYGQMDDRACFGEDGMLAGSGVREASVLRYKEKRRTRLFSKKIRYEVRKLNAERRPRMKGRFVRRLSDI